MPEPDISQPSASLESAVSDGIYDYSLQEHDIIDIARIQYQLTENIDFLVTSSRYYFKKKLHEFLSTDFEESEEFLVSIYDIGDCHWITLVIHRKERDEIFAYYVDSLGAGFNDELKNELLKIMQENNVHELQVMQQPFEYNSGIFALENAIKIIELLNNETEFDEIETQLENVNLNYDDVVAMRKVLAQKLKIDKKRKTTLKLLSKNNNEKHNSQIFDYSNINSNTELLESNAVELIELFLFNPIRGNETGTISVKNPQSPEGFAEKLSLLMGSMFQFREVINSDFICYMFLGSVLTVSNTVLMKKLGLNDVYFKMFKTGENAGVVKFAFLTEILGKKKIILRTMSTENSDLENAYYSENELIEICEKFHVTDRNKNSYELDGMIFYINDKLSLKVEYLKSDQETLQDEFKNLILGNVPSSQNSFQRVEKSSAKRATIFESSYQKLTNAVMEAVKEGATEIFGGITKTFEENELILLEGSKTASAFYGFIYGAISLNFLYRYNIDIIIQTINTNSIRNIVFTAAVDNDTNENWNDIPIVFEFKRSVLTGRKQTQKKDSINFQPNVKTLTEKAIMVFENFEGQTLPTADNINVFQSIGFINSLFTENTALIKKEVRQLYNILSSYFMKNDYARSTFIQRLNFGEIMASSIEKYMFFYTDKEVSRKLTTFLLWNHEDHWIILNIITGDDNFKLDKNIPIENINPDNCRQINIYLNPRTKSGFDQEDNSRDIFLKRNVEIKQIDMSLLTYEGKLTEIGTLDMNLIFSGKKDVTKSISEFKTIIYQFREPIKFESDFQAVVHGLFLSIDAGNNDIKMRSYLESHPSKPEKMNLVVHQLELVSGGKFITKKVIALALKATSITNPVMNNNLIAGMKNLVREFANLKSFKNNIQIEGMLMIFDKDRNVKTPDDIIKYDVESYSSNQASSGNQDGSSNQEDNSNQVSTIVKPSIEEIGTDSSERMEENVGDITDDVKKFCFVSRSKRSTDRCVFEIDTAEANLDTISLDDENFVKHIKTVNSKEFGIYFKNMASIDERHKFIKAAATARNLITGEFTKDVIKLIKAEESIKSFHQAIYTFDMVESGRIIDELVESNNVNLNGIILSAGLLKDSLSKISINSIHGINDMKKVPNVNDLTFGVIKENVKVVSKLLGMVGETEYAAKVLNVVGNISNVTAGFNEAGDVWKTISNLWKNVDEFNSGQKDVLKGIMEVIKQINNLRNIIPNLVGNWQNLLSASWINYALVGVAIGIHIYNAFVHINELDKEIGLTGGEKFFGFFRTIFFMGTSPHLVDIQNRKKINTAVVREVAKFLNNNPNIRWYIVPTRRLVGRDKNIHQIDSSSTVNLNDRRYVTLERGVPRTGNLFCPPSGSDGGQMYTYYCYNAIGIENSNYNPSGSIVFDLGDGSDTAIGYPNGQNVFLVNGGAKQFEGGRLNDLFILKSQHVTGSLDGMGGTDTLVIAFDSYESVTLSLHMNTFNYQLSIVNFENIIGRDGKTDIITCGCGTRYVDGRGGTYQTFDEINIRNLPYCIMKTIVTVRPNTKVRNEARTGDFFYDLQYKQDFDLEVGFLGESNHNYLLGYELKQLLRVSFDKFLKKATLQQYSGKSSSYTMRKVNADGLYLQPRIITKDNAYIQTTENGWAYVFINSNIDRYANTGSLNTSNIFISNGGYKTLTGGNEDDTFILTGRNSHTGWLNGLGGDDSLILEIDFLETESNIAIDFVKNRISNNLSIKSFEKLSARENKTDTIKCNCDTMYIDGRGGTTLQFDEIETSEINCEYMIHIVVRETTSVKTNALHGNFFYDMKFHGNFDVEGEFVDGTNYYYILKHNLSKFDTFHFDNILKNIILKDDSGKESSHKLQLVRNGLYVAPKIVTRDNADIRVQQDGDVLVFIDTSKNPYSSVGCDNVPNFFLVNEGRKNLEGGKKNDVFILNNGHVTGLLNGKGGFNALILTKDFAPGKLVNITLIHDMLTYPGNSGDIVINGMKGVFGREENSEYVVCANDTIFVDLKGGLSNPVQDVIEIPEDDYNNGIHIAIWSHTYVTNNARSGNFFYDVIYQGNFDVEPHFIKGPNHYYILNFELDDLKSVDIGTIVPTITFNRNNNGSSSHFLKAFEGDTYYTQPKFITSDEFEIKVGIAGKLYGFQNTNARIENILLTYPEIASRLEMILFVLSNPTQEIIIIGTDTESEILLNDPEFPTHICGNRGRNTYMITSGNKNIAAIPDVAIYNSNEGSFTDVLDISNIVVPIRKADSPQNLPYVPEVVQNIDDLEIKVSFNGARSALITLKRALITNWHDNIEVILNSASMKIVFSNGSWVLKPLRLFFPDNSKYILITPDDVETDIELAVPKGIYSNYEFTCSGNKNLIITNVFNSELSEEERCTILLYNFYESAVMKTINLKFLDDGRKLSTVSDLKIEDFAEMKNKFEDAINNSVFKKDIIDFKADPSKFVQPEKQKWKKPVTYKTTSSNKNENITPLKNMTSNNQKYTSNRDVYEKVIPDYKVASDQRYRSNNNENRKRSYAQNFESRKSSQSRKYQSKSTINGRYKREIVQTSNKQYETRNDTFQSVKSAIYGLYENILANSFQRLYSYITSSADDHDQNMKQDSLSNSLLDCSNSSLLLLDLIVRKITRRKYVSTGTSTVSLLVAESYALRIVADFENILRKSAFEAGISMRNINFNPISVQSEITAHVRNGKFSDISRTLYKTVSETCPKNKQCCKFLQLLKIQIENFLSKKEVEMLYESEKYERGMNGLEIENVQQQQPRIENKTETLLEAMSEVNIK